ncbi:hypothetical protein BAJUN_02760 [Bajunvirus bajun]|uniref:Tail assembly chaperone n=1 Tax=Brevundimonas phage vB_BgoS-Bajun TaxID=2948594 RepID=A0A9E7N799_9CAUD|nr:hypothetical protein BAJUN_02760 [Brevundimonas phage vB_BgoS-Bajun]
MESVKAAQAGGDTSDLDAELDEEPDDPEPAGNQPFPDLMWAWDGFWRLSNKRPQGFNGPLRIPLTEIESFARLKGWDHEKRNDFLFYVDKLDEAYMVHVAAEIKKQEDATKINAGQPPPKGRR